MDKLNRGDKIYLDKQNEKESAINTYLDCRDGTVEVYEYRDGSGYGHKTRLFLCEDKKHETVSIIRQVHNDIIGEWIEEEMAFDADSLLFLKAILNGKKDEIGGTYSLVRDY